MRFPQLLVYEADGRFARMLEGTAGTHRWALREPRRVDSCLRLLRRGGPAIVVVKLENDLESAFSLVEQTSWLFPEAAVVVVTDRESSVLTDLAWDLGAGYVLAPPRPRDAVLEVVANLMGTVTSSDDASS
jgi:ActR/RegA family two-component response regulator